MSCSQSSGKTWIETTGCPTHALPTSIRLFFSEKILIQPLELDRAVATNSDAVFDHQICQLSPVDEDHPLCKVFNIIARRLAEGRGRNENAFSCAKADEAAHEAIDVRTPYRTTRRIPLGLDIDAVEAEAIFVYDAIDTTVPGAAELAGSVLVATTITHGDQMIDNQLLKKAGLFTRIR
jgi:hypothetical protein